jgi:hypothetical protein
LRLQVVEREAGRQLKARRNQRAAVLHVAVGVDGGRARAARQAAQQVLQAAQVGQLCQRRVREQKQKGKREKHFFFFLFSGEKNDFFAFFGQLVKWREGGSNWSEIFSLVLQSQLKWIEVEMD